MISVPVTTEVPAALSIDGVSFALVPVAPYQYNVIEFMSVSVIPEPASFVMSNVADAGAVIEIKSLAVEGAVGLRTLSSNRFQ